MTCYRYSWSVASWSVKYRPWTTCFLATLAFIVILALIRGCGTSGCIHAAHGQRQRKVVAPAAKSTTLLRASATIKTAHFDRILLGGGRIFECGALTSTGCLEGALASSVNESIAMSLTADAFCKASAVRPQPGLVTSVVSGIRHSGARARVGPASRALVHDEIFLEGRRFICNTDSRPDCLSAALAASINETAAFRTMAGSCCRAHEVTASGAFCVSKAQPGVGGNNLFDPMITAAMCSLAHGASVLDLGCGVGHYADSIAACGVPWRGYDGSLNIVEATSGRVGWADLSVPIYVGAADWVLSLEVGEHLPRRFAGVYLDNVARHSRKGIVLSWALPDQVGHHHVNGQPNEFVVTSLAARGFELDRARTSGLREAASLGFFKRTIFVFRRIFGSADGGL